MLICCYIRTSAQNPVLIKGFFNVTAYSCVFKQQISFQQSSNLTNTEQTEQIYFWPPCLDQFSVALGFLLENFWNLLGLMWQVFAELILSKYVCFMSKNGHELKYLSWRVNSTNSGTFYSIYSKNKTKRNQHRCRIICIERALFFTN